MLYIITLHLQNFKKIKDQLLSHHTNVNLKLCIKIKFINRIIKYLIWMKFDVHIKNIKNMKFNG